MKNNKKLNNDEEIKEYSEDVTKKPVSDGPEELNWKPGYIERSNKKIKLKKIFALGDLHGWAPGLITYLISNQLAKISVNNLPLFENESNHLILHKKNLAILFLNPIKHLNETGKFPISWLKDFNLNNSKNAESGFHSIKAEWIGEDDVVFIQMGDIFDRADYSELTAEILRQLVIQAPNQVFILMGNHEQFLIEGDFTNWYYNEQRFRYQEGSRNKKFHSRFHSKTYGWDIDVNEDLIEKEVFTRYRVSACLLYITQHCAKSKIYPLLNEFTNKIDIKIDRVLNGGWAAYRYIEEEILKKINANDLQYFPGAIIMLGMGHSFFVHAEPKAFLTFSNFEALLPVDDLFILSCYHMASIKSDITNSIDYPLLWARGGWEGSLDSNPHPTATDYIGNLVKNLPGVRHLIHGHTPTTTINSFVDLNGNYPISYLARNFGDEVTNEIGSVRIHMIEEGICPIYYKEDENRVYDPTRVPVGLRIHDKIHQYQLNGPENLESKEEEWWVVVKPSESTIFEIPELTLKNRVWYDLFKPNNIIWSYQTRHSKLPKKRFIIDNDEFKNYIMFTDYSEVSISEKGVRFLLYDRSVGQSTGKVFEEPKKLYSHNKKKNIPIDQIVFDWINDVIDEWLKNGDEEDPFLKSKKERKSWLDEYSFNARDNLGEKLYELVEYNGILALLSHSLLIYGRIGLDQNQNLGIFLINQSTNPIYFNVDRFTLNSQKSDLIKPEQWKWIKLDPKELKKQILSWNITQLPNETVFGLNSLEEIQKKSDTNTLREHILDSDMFGGLIWFESKNQVPPFERNTVEGSFAYSELYDSQKTSKLNYNENQNNKEKNKEDRK